MSMTLKGIRIFVQEKERDALAWCLIIFLSVWSQDGSFLMMNMFSNSKVEKFLDDIQFQSPEKFEVLKSIRKIFNDANPKLDEDIKYGGLVFNLSNTLMGGIFVYSAHISIEFSFGFELADPDNMLEGKGKKRRYIKILKMQDIEDKQVKIFVVSAMNRDGG